MRWRRRREVGFLLLPVVALGVFGWAKNQGLIGTGALFNEEPIRIEVLPIEAVGSTLFPNSQGYDWTGSVPFRVRGNIALPRHWKLNHASPVSGKHEQRLEYRSGKVWKTVVTLSSSDPVGEAGVTTGLWDLAPLKIGVKLNRVPSDAEEVRLRGVFMATRTYITGSVSGGEVKDPNIQYFSGGIANVVLKSAPYEILIKGPNEPLPLTTMK